MHMQSDGNFVLRRIRDPRLGNEDFAHQRSPIRVSESMRIVIEAVVVTSDGWRLWRELRLAALAEAPAAFGSTLAEWSGAVDTEQRWRARLEDVALNLVFDFRWRGGGHGERNRTRGRSPG